ncbi:glycoside hydrolase superfamily [Phyllosticta citrichinensis]|uniref:Glycoside hydrolase superfamily n=1 Tax=Phyllosticta citrichinensis TaxID=1130410 RepID=A0ABR1XRQ6_9PEZI
MKAGIFLTLVSLLGFSAAQPHRHHRHLHNERRALVTEVEIVTVTAPLVVVEVFESETFTFTEGMPQIPVPTSTTELLPPPPPPPPTSSSEPPPAPPSTPLPPIVVPPPAPTSSEQPPARPPPPSPTTLSSTTQAPPPPPPVSIPEPTASAPQSSLAPAPTFSPGPVNNGYGISYNPYNDDGTCKNADAVSRDIDLLKDYAMLRIYGCDCDQLNTVFSAVKRYDGMRLFLGIYNVNNAASEAQQIVDAIKKRFNGDWSRVDTVSVGNEAVKNGAASVGQVIAGIRAARGVLNGGGYDGPVVTVDTIETFLNSDGSGLQLCKESDYNAANCHAFFDNSGYFNKGSDAGRFVQMQVERFKQGCGNRRTVIAESGWPHSTSWSLSAFGNRPIPDEENHRAAIASLKEAFVGNKSDLVLFSAHNNLWKMDYEGTMGTEKFWGILDASFH